MNDKYVPSDLMPLPTKKRVWREEPPADVVETEAARNRRRIQALQKADQVSDRNEHLRKLSKAKPARLKSRWSDFRY
ncbi:MAG: hypothetical protein RLZZ283_728 [Candidatus Parcubacteria bacterium]|jgi:hypothetical protein